jgi:hypothetical protein
MYMLSGEGSGFDSQFLHNFSSSDEDCLLPFLCVVTASFGSAGRFGSFWAVAWLGFRKREADELGGLV